MEDLILAEDEQSFFDEASTVATLGPNYFAARMIAERFTQHFSDEMFRPLIDQFVDKFREKLWDDVSAWLLTDTESNLQSEIWRRVDSSVAAILSGNEQMIEHYALQKYDRDEVRGAIAKAIPKELQDLRVQDLEEENKRLKERIEMYQERYR